MYGFLLRFTSNLWHILADLRHKSRLHMSVIDFDLSKSLNVKCYGAVGLPISDILLSNWCLLITHGLSRLLLMVNSNIWPNSAFMRYIILRNLSDLEFDI